MPSYIVQTLIRISIGAAKKVYIVGYQVCLKPLGVKNNFIEYIKYFNLYWNWSRCPNIFINYGTSFSP